MLLKMLFRAPGAADLPSYQKALRFRQKVALGVCAVGVVGTLCYFLLVRGSGLPDFVRGFYLGAAQGFLLSGIILFCRVRYLLRHPKAQKEALVRERDEREQTIREKSASAAGMITFFAAAAALFVLLPFSRSGFFALLAVIGIYTAAFFAGNTYFSRKI